MPGSRGLFVYFYIFFTVGVVASALDAPEIRVATVFVSAVILLCAASIVKALGK